MAIVAWRSGPANLNAEVVSYAQAYIPSFLIVASLSMELSGLNHLEGRSVTFGLMVLILANTLSRLENNPPARSNIVAGLGHKAKFSTKLAYSAGMYRPYSAKKGYAS